MKFLVGLTGLLSTLTTTVKDILEKVSDDGDDIFERVSDDAKDILVTLKHCFKVSNVSPVSH